MHLFKYDNRGGINFCPYVISFGNVIHIIVYLPMSNESLIEDTVIKSYLELYLRSLNESRSHRFIQVIKKRMIELIKRKQQKPQ